MKLLYGTTNVGKVHSMKKHVLDLPIEIIDLKQVEPYPFDLDENGQTPIENAMIKAKAYYRYYKMPVLSADSGLYFKNAKPEHQPGLHVRNINGKRLNDEEMIAYYSNLAKMYNDLIAYYENGLCLIVDEEHIYTTKVQSKTFLLTSTPKPQQIAGFPLDALSVDIETKEEKNTEVVTPDSSYHQFLKKVINEFC